MWLIRVNTFRATCWKHNFSKNNKILKFEKNTKYKKWRCLGCFFLLWHCISMKLMTLITKNSVSFWSDLTKKWRHHRGRHDVFCFFVITGCGFRVSRPTQRVLSNGGNEKPKFWSWTPLKKVLLFTYPKKIVSQNLLKPWCSARWDESDGTQVLALGREMAKLRIHQCFAN